MLKVNSCRAVVTFCVELWVSLSPPDTHWGPWWPPVPAKRSQSCRSEKYIHRSNCSSVCQFSSTKVIRRVSNLIFRRMIFRLVANSTQDCCLLACVARKKSQRHSKALIGSFCPSSAYQKASNSDCFHQIADCSFLNPTRQSFDPKGRRCTAFEGC